MDFFAYVFALHIVMLVYFAISWLLKFDEPQRVSCDPEEKIQAPSFEAVNTVSVQVFDDELPF